MQDLEIASLILEPKFRGGYSIPGYTGVAVLWLEKVFIMDSSSNCCCSCTTFGYLSITVSILSSFFLTWRSLVTILTVFVTFPNFLLDSLWDRAVNEIEGTCTTPTEISEIHWTSDKDENVTPMDFFPWLSFDEFPMLSVEIYMLWQKIGQSQWSCGTFETLHTYQSTANIGTSTTLKKYSIETNLLFILLKVYLYFNENQ